jgi:hypothetical protein
MALLEPLFKELMKVCPNGVLPNLKLKSALVSAHHAQPIFHIKGDPDDLSSKASGRIRMMAAKYRDIYIDETKYGKCMGKAGGLHTKRSIHQLKKTLGLRRVWKCC